MSRHRIASRFTMTAVILFALLAGSANSLHAQQAVAPLSPSSALEPAATAAPAAPASQEPAQPGPRVTPPLESYQGTLPQSKYDSMAQDSEGSRHTIVLSTLALVLIGVIVVLLAT